MTESLADVKARLLQDPATRKAYDAWGDLGIYAEVYAESVARGCKPVALVAQWEELNTEDLIELAFAYGSLAERWGIRLYAHSTHIDGKLIHEFFFYKHPHLGDVLDELYSREPDEVLYHWIWGKLFGYSEEEIGDFIQNQEDKDPE